MVRGLRVAVLLGAVAACGSGCVVMDHDRNVPRGFTDLESLRSAFNNVKKGQTKPEVEGVLKCPIEDRNFEIQGGPKALEAWYGGDKQPVYQGILNSPEKVDAFEPKEEFLFVGIVWRDVVRKYDRIYLNTQTFSEYGEDNQYSIVFKKNENNDFQVLATRATENHIAKDRERSSLFLIVTDIFGLPQITPNPPSVPIPGATIK